MAPLTVNAPWGQTGWWRLLREVLEVVASLLPVADRVRDSSRILSGRGIVDDAPQLVTPVLERALDRKIQ